MYPDDRVLVGVVNRQKDFERLRYQQWYRIPHGRSVKGIYAEYLAFFLSRSFKEKNGGIHYYAKRTGHELVRRCDLLPDEANHARANDLYYKIQLGELRERVPPILNPTRRPVVFVYTTWDRFVAAHQIADLYSTADHFVDRVAFALRQQGIPTERIWEAEQRTDDGGAHLHIKCQSGDIVATTAQHVLPDRLELAPYIDVEAIQQTVARIRKRIDSMGGLLGASIPLEG